MNLRPVLWAAVWCAAGAAGLGPPSAVAAEVREVRVERLGAAPVDEGSVRSMLNVRAGQEFDAAVVMQDVKALEKTKRYSLVDVRREAVEGGVAVIYAVRAKPLIVRIGIEGADELGNKKVRELLALGVGDRVDEAAMAGGARKVQDEYLKKYYPHAHLSWKIAEDEKTGRADVHVVVKEGPRAKIWRVEFAGNTVFTADELRVKMKQRRYRWYNPVHWFKGTGRLDDDELSEDRYTLRRLYTDRGYLDAQIGEPEVRLAGAGALEIRVRVTEGRPYRVGQLSFEGLTKYPETEIRPRVEERIQSGAPASLKAIEDAADAVLDYYGNRGYIRMSVDPRIDPDAKTGVADLHFVVKEGKISYLRDIRIRGNAITQDKVIRRELVVYPGEKYNRSRVKTSEKRLMNLGYFADVQSVNETTPEPDKSDLVFDVQEQRMGMASASVGFSSIDQLYGFFEVSHGNIDLRSWPPVGAGEKIRLRMLVGTQRRDEEIEFIEPYFLDRKLSLGVELYHRDMNYISSHFEEKVTGGEVSLTKPLNAFDRLSLAYGLDDYTIDHMSTNAPPDLLLERGTKLRSSLTLAWTHDTRNATFIPSRGNNTRLATTLAGGPLGGESDWYRLQAQSSQYLQPFTAVGLSHVLMLRGVIGTMDGLNDDEHPVSIYDRYFLGGANTIRAYKYRRVGPAYLREDGSFYDAHGGLSEASATLEYTIPLWKEKESGPWFQGVRFATFVDGGMVWADAYDWDLKWDTGYGIGLRLDIPFLPLRLDYSWPLQTQETWNESKNGRFSFMIGYGF